LVRRLLLFSGRRSYNRSCPEIQELRHRSQSGDASDASRVIDQSLVQLDERLESVAQGIKAINESLEPLLQSVKTPTPISQNGKKAEETAVLRKHADMLYEWEAVQKESQVLREELKEDKWLTVFRTVTDQADGMMSSLEKAINRCQVRSMISAVSVLNGKLIFDTHYRISYTKLTNMALTTPSVNHPP
jgi:hypothetical protein